MLETHQKLMEKDWESDEECLEPFSVGANERRNEQGWFFEHRCGRQERNLEPQAQRKFSLKKLVVSMLAGSLVGAVVFLAGNDLEILEHEPSYSCEVAPEGPVAADESSEICLTPACVQAASILLSNMSPKYSEIDPCKNFNQYACGGFSESHDLRADQSSVGTPSVMAENGQRILRRVLEAPDVISQQDFEARSSAKDDIFHKLKDSYNACMDEDQIKKQGSGPLLEVLGEVGALYPAPDPEVMVQGIDANLTRTVAFLAGFGVDAILSFGVGVSN